MQRLLGGIAGGILGAVLFGVVLQVLGLMTSVGALVNWEAVDIGWFVQIAVGAVLGVVYAVTLGIPARGWLSGAVTGLVYGALAWAVGWQLVLPTLVEAPTLDAGRQAFFTLGGQTFAILGGHLLYGLVLGLVVAAAVTYQPAEG